MMKSQSCPKCGYEIILDKKIEPIDFIKARIHFKEMSLEGSICHFCSGEGYLTAENIKEAQETITIYGYSLKEIYKILTYLGNEKVKEIFGQRQGG